MKLLVFLEPVIFQSNPAFYAAHFTWLEYWKNVTDLTGGRLAVAANQDVLDAWGATHGRLGGAVDAYPLDPFRPLGQVGFNRKAYSKLVYGAASVGEGNDLLLALRSAVESFGPDLVIMSSQNSLARAAFGDLPILNVEQSPLPRYGHPFRTAFDPVGHQVGAMLETFVGRIKSLAVETTLEEPALRLLDAVKLAAAGRDTYTRQACTELTRIRGEGRVALLVTQPPDAVTYEGAYEGMELENLLYAWGEALPAGWLGVPTYHPGHKLSAEMEAALARSSSRLRFLPQALSQGFTEALSTVADGMITISSTSAVSGLLFGKKVVVTGRSPYSAWCPHDPSELEAAVPLSAAEAASLLVFLTHRHALTDHDIRENPRRLAEVLEIVRGMEHPEEWFFDVEGWSLERAERLFRFEEPLSDAARQNQNAMFDAALRKLSEAEAVRDVYKSEWEAAVAQRDKLCILVEEISAERDLLRKEWSRVASEIADALAQRDSYKSEWSASVAQRDRLDQELAHSREEADALRAQNHQAHDELTRVGGELGSYKEEWAKAVAGRDKFIAMFNAASAREEVVRGELRAVASQRDNLKNTLVHKETKLNVALSGLNRVREAMKRSRSLRIVNGLEKLGLEVEASELQPDNEAEGAAGSQA